MAEIVEIEFVEHDHLGEDAATAFFGRVVARTDVRGMTEAERAKEVEEMHEILGDFVVAREVERVG